LYTLFKIEPATILFGLVGSIAMLGSQGSKEEKIPSLDSSFTFL